MFIEARLVHPISWEASGLTPSGNAQMGIEKSKNVISR